MHVIKIKNDLETIVIHSRKSKSKLLSASVRQGINAIDTFSFTISKSNPGYSFLRELKTLITVYDTKKEDFIFEGRILDVYEAMDENGSFKKEVTCESELGYLNDSTQRHGEFHNISPEKFLMTILDNHNKQTEPEKHFFVGNVNVKDTNDSLYKYLTYDQTFNTIKEKLIKTLGGEIRVRKSGARRYLDWLVSFGEDKTTEIKLKKNLKTIKRTPDATEIISRLVPLGNTIATQGATDASQKRLDISKVNGGKDYIDDAQAIALFGIVEKAVIWDDVTNATVLLRKGNDYIAQNNRIKMKTEITALDLSLINLDIDSFEIYNTYQVINPIMGIDDRLRLTEKQTNIISPESSQITFGDKMQKMTEYQAETNKAKQQVISLGNIVIAQERKLITVNTRLTETQEIINSLEKAINEADIESAKEAFDDLKATVIETDRKNAESFTLIKAEMKSVTEKQALTDAKLEVMQLEINALKNK
ncbi:phage tail protein [Listeria marthii]|uniref:phage tail protein n=1 Tax=Listeria marthii TaxID=529731 RepID=UPI001887EC3F|nr:phage tail protein [Listeria marthii]MBF2536435.1 phage tail protein [Listeria marthii]